MTRRTLTPSAPGRRRSTGSADLGRVAWLPQIAACSTVLLAVAVVLWPMTVSGILLTVVAVIAVLLNERVAWVVYVVGLSLIDFRVPLGVGFALPEHLLFLPVFAHIALKRHRQGQALRELAPLIAVFAAWLAASSLATLANSLEVRQSAQVMALVVASFVAFVALRIGGGAEWRAKWGVAAAAAVAGGSVAAWAVATSSGRWAAIVESDYQSELLRPQWFMSEPNLLASYCVLWFCVMVAWRACMSRIQLWVCGCLLIVPTALTLTRAAFVGLVLAVILLYFRSSWGPWKVAATVGLAVVALLASLGTGAGRSDAADSRLLGVGTERLSRIADFESGTGALRSRTWQLALDDIERERSWATGLGTNSFEQRHSFIQSSTGRLYLGNLWLGTYYDGGPVALLSLCGLYVLIWRRTPDRVASSAFFLALAVISIATNPTWFAYSWAAMAVLPTRPVTVVSGKPPRRPT